MPLNSAGVQHDTHGFAHGFARKVLGKLSTYNSVVSMSSTYFAPNHSKLGVFLQSFSLYTQHACMHDVDKYTINISQPAAKWEAAVKPKDVTR